MPAVQTTYSERIGVARAGMVADERNYDSITRINETAAGIGFGLAVKQGSTDGVCALAGAIAAFLGVSIRDVTLESSQLDKYADGQAVGILTAGPIWVEVSDTPGVSDPVHFSATTGVFATSGGTGPIVGARWMKGAVTDQDGKTVALLHLPNYSQAA